MNIVDAIICYFLIFPEKFRKKLKRFNCNTTSYINPMYFESMRSRLHFINNKVLYTYSFQAFALYWICFESFLLEGSIALLNYQMLSVIFNFLEKQTNNLSFSAS